MSETEESGDSQRFKRASLSAVGHGTAATEKIQFKKRHHALIQQKSDLPAETKGINNVEKQSAHMSVREQSCHGAR